MFICKLRGPPIKHNLAMLLNNSFSNHVYPRVYLNFTDVNIVFYCTEIAILTIAATDVTNLLNVIFQLTEKYGLPSWHHFLTLYLL